MNTSKGYKIGEMSLLIR